MDDLPHELCVMIGNFASKKLFEISLGTYRVHCMASNETEAIRLLVEEYIEINSKKVNYLGLCDNIIRDIRDFIDLHIDQEEVVSVFTEQEYNVLSWVIEGQKRLISQYKDEFIEFFKGRHNVRKIDIMISQYLGIK